DNNSITLLKINRETGALESVVKDTLYSNVDEVYGICQYHSQVSGKHFVFINGKNGVIEQWELQWL
ncbi:phytase, partial [Bacteroidota bacterium]